MKTIGIITETVEMVLRKERKGTLKKSQIQTAARVAVSNFFDKQILIYQATKVLPPSLRNFLTTATVNISNSVGSLPENFAKEVTFYVPDVNSNPADIITREEFEERKTSVLKTPTETDPIGTIEGGQILVKPQSLSQIKLTYLKRPTDVVIGTTLSGDGRELTYNDNTSTDTEFPSEYAPDLIKEALMFLGVPSQDDGAMALAETTKV